MPAWLNRSHDAESFGRAGRPGWIIRTIRVHSRLQGPAPARRSSPKQDSKVWIGALARGCGAEGIVGGRATGDSTEPRARAVRGRPHVLGEWARAAERSLEGRNLHVGSAASATPRTARRANAFHRSRDLRFARDLARFGVRPGN
jgi:hypothetical protein